MPRHWRLWLAVGLGSAALGAGLSRTGFVETIEAKSYDWRVRTFPLDGDDGPTRAALVLVDEKTLAFFGEQDQLKWPYPRDLYCPVLRFLKASGAVAVVFDVQFSEPDEFDPVFAECIRETGFVVLPYQCRGDREPAPVPGAVPVDLPGGGPDPCRPLLAAPDLREAARSGGRIDMEADPDGVLRYVTPLWPAEGGAAPTLGLAPLLLDAAPGDVRFEGGDLVVGSRRLPLDAAGRLLVPWRDGDPPFPTHSFATVFANGELMAEGKPTALPEEELRGKVVFLGTSAAGTYEVRVTPIREADVGIHLHASVFHGADTGRLVRRAPRIADDLVTAGLAFSMAAVSLLLPSVVPYALSLVAALLLVSLFWGAALLLYAKSGLWVGLVAPSGAMFVAFLAGSVLNYLTEGRERRRIRHAFQHYLAPAVVADLVRDPSKLRLGGERREITAFFSDIAGFTSISESLEPSVLVTLMNECLSELSQVILDEGGTIDKYVGDAIVAMFGAPLDDPDHAARACRAALHCQKRMAELREVWKAEGLPPLEVRIGLNSGVALVGNMGSKQRFDYTMLGDVVNLASRLEGTNKAYGTPILVGEETRRLAGDAIRMRPIDVVRVVGKKKPVEVFTPYATAGESTPDDDRIASRYADAFAAYRRREFEVAAGALLEVLEIRPGDRASKTLLARIEHLETHPPPEDWDGVYDVTTK